MEVVNTDAIIITVVMLVNAIKDFSWMVMERLAQVNSVCEHLSTTVI